MAEAGGFSSLGPSEVAQLAYVGVKAAFKTVEIDLQPGEVTDVWADFRKLIEAYAQPAKGYTARRAMQAVKDVSDYDHLSRFGEWDMTADAVPEDMA